MNQKWSIRPYQDRDAESILELWKMVHPDREYDREKWLRWWRWMYKDNPAGNGLIWLAEDEGKIVGQYAVIPIMIKIGTKIIVAAQSLDTMTHPDYRRQKMFETLAKKVYQDAAANGVFIIYGFPNQFSHPGFINKLGWFDISATKVMLMSFNWRNAFKLKVNNGFLQIVLATGAGFLFNRLFWRTQKTPVIKGLTITKITSFDERFDDLWARICNQSQIMVMRNRDYLNWRYNTPDVNYSILAAEKDHQIYGYIVIQHKIQKAVKRSIIFDLIATTQEIMNCLIASATEESRQKGTSFILYFSIANNYYHGILKRNGFIPLPFMGGGHFSIYSSSQSISKNFLSNQKNWIVQFGDSDAV